MKKVFNWLLYKAFGWKKEVTVEHPEKFILALAPHTSNWDFVVGICYMYAEGMRINFLMKKEWFFWPLGPIFKRLGGIPVWRSKKTNMTDNLAAQAKEMKEFRLCITPEGTRSPVSDWKKGFYYIALKAEIPILLYGADYERKLIQCTKVIVPTGDIEADMAEIKDYFRNFKGKKPENFLL